MTRREASEAEIARQIAAAFKAAEVTEADVTRAIDSAFGRAPVATPAPASGGLRQRLKEAHVPEAAHARIESDVADGYDLPTAVAIAAAFSSDPAWRSLDKETLLRGEGSAPAALEAIRKRLVQARVSTARISTEEAQAYVDAVIKAADRRAVREGWTSDELRAHLKGLEATIRNQSKPGKA